MTGWLDDKHVVFGEVADKESMRVVKGLEATDNPRKKKGQDPIIVAAGQL